MTVKTVVKFIQRLLFTEFIFISLCSTSFFLAGNYLLGLDFPPYSAISAVFLSTLFVYRFSHFVSSRRSVDGSISLMHQFRSGQFVILLVLACILLLHLVTFSISATFAFSVLGILSILYSYPVLGLPSLRQLPLLKTLLITLIWAIVGSMLPMLLALKPVGDFAFFRIFTGHFFFILAITIPFDIRDFATDKRQNIITIPIKYGIKTSVLIALASLSIFIISMSVFVELIPLMLFSAGTGFLIINVAPGIKGYRITLLLDAMIIVYFVLVLFYSK